MMRLTKSRLLVACVVCAGPLLVLTVALGAPCPDNGPVNSLCPGVTSSGCNGTAANCSSDNKEVIAEGNFACGKNKGQKNCRTGTMQALCYTKWKCKWVVLTGCVQDDNTKDEHNAATMTSDGC
ncbi:hypothetical protein [Singulisphaera acidiphila]|uniref:Secreted protein n=1 Tax=Singulisphaera acidiphila (strain ATCC BAA-1392 / DSM 18658 / VKM B-2454 / MOB10) TaxID=886293 RepID=L0DI24_SINAD|nr:hypothetical protein [Singulisphaera acidiphila]AGA29044.1 hypothetical protein Sinac_4886 [Singulisphaera acidiphila DSM 18658]